MVKFRLVLLISAALAFGWWWRVAHQIPTVLAFRIDQHFDEVTKNSTYPVLERSTIPREEFDGSGMIWVAKPAVIIKYDDPTNGFTLPPTKFAGVGISRYRVNTVRTSPMLEPLPFEQAVQLLQELQDQFKAAGWQPWEGDESVWFDFSPKGRKRLYDSLFVYSGRSTTLVVPRKNLDMVLIIRCFGDYCQPHNDQARFLIDIGIGKKSYYDYKGE